MAKKDKKTAALEKAARKEAKKNKQAEKANKGATKKSKRELAAAGEEDIEVLLNRMDNDPRTRELEGQKKVRTEVLEAPPSPRLNMSMTVTNSGDVLVFGGEFFDGDRQTVYNDTLRWDIDKGEWKKVEPPVSPKPRCAHQAVLVNNRYVYIFGGEFSTVSQFHHYRDLWRFDLKTNLWEEIKATGDRPSQRSGHRMLVWKGYIILFGGFYDTFRECKYFNDLHMFNITEEKWYKVDFSNVPSLNLPAPRGGCLFFVHPQADMAYLYGGYSRDTKQNATSGTEHTDMWALNLKNAANTLKPTWERLSKKGPAPSKRSGMACAVYKNRCLVFGGVTDEDKPGLTLESRFYNDLHAFDMERKRWYVLDYKLGQKKPQEKKSRRNREGKSSKANTSTFAASVSDPTESLSAEEEEDETAKFEWQFEYVDENGQLVTMIIPEEDRTSSEESDEDQRTPAATPAGRAEVEEPIATPEVLRARRAEGLATVQEETEEACPTLIDEKGSEEKQATPEAGATGVGKMTAAEALKMGNVDLPVERINSALLVKGHTLIVYGGLREYGDREVTFDDCWSLDLRQRTKWTCLLKGTMSEQKWMGSDDELSDDDEGEDGDLDDADWSSSGESSDEDEEEVEEAEQLQQEKKKKASRKSAKLRERMEEIRSQWDLKEEYTPRLEESLRDFAKRTMDHWAEVQEAKMIEEAKASGDMDNAELRRAIMDRKEVRRLAFSLAEERYNEVRDVLVELKEMEEEQAVGCLRVDHFQTAVLRASLGPLQLPFGKRSAA
ncbi:kelch domain containing 4 [Perkinsus olseni]|uniref:Kelch domain containing 4 n=1 Tax=Perkinsus olseni TaxID=32597 RepID=A0A7J6LNN0_PEROL|nr:kelch domain containing 4 [Perkinsus olseni]